MVSLIVSTPVGALFEQGARSSRSLTTTARSANCSRSICISVSVPSVPTLSVTTNVSSNAVPVVVERKDAVVGEVAGEHGGVEVRSARST